MYSGNSMRDTQRALINTLLLKRDLFHFLDTVALPARPIHHVALAAGGFWLVNQPEAIGQVLNADEHWIGKPDFLLASNRGEHGDGLSSLSGEQWQARRALLARAFTPALHARMAAETRAVVAAAMAQWPQETPIDLAELFSRLVTHAGARWILSADVRDDGSDGAIPWHEAAGVRYRVDVPGAAHDLMPSQRLRAGAVPVLRKLIQRKWRAQHESDDFLGTLRACCRAQDAQLGEAAVFDELVQLLFAAHHTVTTTLVYCVDFLHRHPGHAERIASCARMHAGQHSGDPGASNYTAYFIKEVMRFCMPTTLLFRQTRQAQTIVGEATGAGDLLVISPYLLHRNEQHFPDPMRFDPLRFSAQVSRYAYLPFGAGPRRCIAQRLALLQMQIIIEALVLGARIAPLQAAPHNRYALSYPGPAYPVRYARLPH